MTPSPENGQKPQRTDGRSWLHRTRGAGPITHNSFNVKFVRTLKSMISPLTRMDTFLIASPKNVQKKLPQIPRIPVFL